ncbi:transglutaminase family protein [Neisseria zalophi]|uniref:DUF3488 domain-containing protein n=1 Tax=Neisseria zalophi TaxID=640030 RepID=A0A5J6PWF5_9NEIS|nr:DUF3488 and transglutaminase-like domain-containing protein [Neisseria zalophi]QEY25172.1 DUF3488 domain-containing protein [Neisseria zalophi]
MLIANPSFLKQTPPPAAAATVLLTLLLTALPLVTALPVPVMITFAVLWLSRLAILKLNTARIPKAALIVVMFAAGALVWQQLGTVFGREGGISFLLLMIMLKAFEGGSRRDWQVLLLAMLFLIGSSVLLNQNLLIGAWLLTALPAVGICFAVLCGLGIKESAKHTFQALLLTLPLMALLFVAVPRLSEPLWSIPQEKGQAKTGLSDTMEPGSISNLVQSDEWVANITFADGFIPRQSDLYWRAVIMADFDSIRWQALDDTNIDEARPIAEAADTISYQIVIQDQNRVLPALDYPTGDMPRRLTRRAGQTIRAYRSREGLRRLNLQATAKNTLNHKLYRSEYARYTHLPENGNLQTRQLAQTLAEQSGNPRQFIDKVLHYYRSRPFRYTLQPPRTPGRNGIDEFMFRTLEGFCEHYAQSFVVMMRAAGLPARIVTGYLGAEYNSQAGFWQIRSKDAHAWAEVWLPDEQVWLRVDPTAAVSSARTESGIREALPETERNMVSDGQSTFARWQDTSRFYWQQWVVNYDQSRQNNLFSLLGLGGFNAQTLLLVLPVGLLIALLPLLRWWHKNRQSERDYLNEGFSLLKTALMGPNDETAAATSAGELQTLLRENRLEDKNLTRLLRQYEQWLYATERPAKSTQKSWYKAAAKIARHYARNHH